MGLIALLAIPAGLVFGAVWALVVIGITLSLMGTAAYLFYVRHGEYMGLIEMVRRDMEVLESERDT